MSRAAAEQISLFRSQIEDGSFSDVTLLILESVLVAKNMRALLEIRSSLQKLLRSKAKLVMDRIAAKSADEKLRVAEFFVKAFALVGDVESCLALRYEALVLRETKYYNYNGFRVSYQEWYTFAKDSFYNGYYAIAVKGFDSALSCFQSEWKANENNVDFLLKDNIVDKIRKLRDEASSMISSSSVQALTSKYLKRKATEDDQRCTLFSTNSQQAASSMFRLGINKRNAHKLFQSQRQKQLMSGP
ncbi:uncharacterized protein LOC110025627 isoform X2 [Phalaenopsis equestris]|uniref:uncharacterized protein LOC110025627 isoform X2 n=1 Tax=Phalaenopsis equestris TaxID=78828 RepID=UPI0009E400BB|nr:uncharacterized protein LOC110025627 isoform X2 [Phalaenopsis equestris]